MKENPRTQKNREKKAALPRRAIGLALIIGWGMLGGLMGTRLYFQSLSTDDPMPWLPYFLSYFMAWIYWAFVTPLIMLLGRKLPIDRSHWLRNGALHFLFSIMFVALQAYFHAAIGSFFWSTLDNYTFTEAWGYYGMPYFMLYRIPWMIVFYWMILGAYLAMNYYRLSRQRELRALQLQSELAESQLSALSNQLQPHFLFNALHSVVSLVEHGETRKAIDMLTGLSDLLRLTLKRRDSNEITLEEELHLLDKYIEIEKTRFADRLTINVDISEETSQAYVPRFLLQPLVENAIRHGIGKLSGAGTICVSARRTGETVRLEISDDGVGLRSTTDSDGTGLGLEATRRLLSTLYGDNGHLALMENEQGGATVRIDIPYRTQAVHANAGATE